MTKLIKHIDTTTKETATGDTNGLLRKLVKDPEIKEFISQLIEKLQERYYGASAWTEAFTKEQLEGWIKDKVWFMPAGDSRESLFKSYPLVFDWVRDNGYRMTWRPHIIAFEDQREV